MLVYLLVLIYVQSVVSFPFFMNLYTKTCITNQPLNLEQSFSLTQGIRPDMKNPIDFGYIYKLHSPTVHLNSDIDTQTPEHVSSVISHLKYNENTNILSIEAWMSSTNRFRIQELGETIHLELRTFSFDSSRRLDRFTSNPQVAAQVQSMQLAAVHTHGLHKVSLELKVPLGWLTDSKNSICKQVNHSKDQFHEIVDSAVLM